ncbi:CRISPR system precrRNA processing endoribonuclease RAMP protein Cas6 [Spirulina sp. CCNP1310]|uniref:CRISPR system precrRNA processing endoribonuclease RAMP protein Cas6 n=1 Tax=Spirulina sp. CCNP1310 TaxID=3110249 RepID=UPI002B1E92BD|nr:CRISPR system precrRNA processing endoribonuclease RAMP protein Cas6 [Spirulina sp. CCNP1310]MEA5420422.1 CRISPR system precrRNA processing endoribonuclease RAMP protein Cas6 [Spirulina sp. CCNP1310]
MLYGLSLTLTPAPAAEPAIPLADWLPMPFGLIPWGEGVFLALRQPEDYGAAAGAIAAQILAGGTVAWGEGVYRVRGLEREAKPLQMIRVELQGERPFPKEIGRACQALVLDWFKRADPALAQRLHDQSPCPWRLYPRLEGDRRLYLEIGLLQGELLAPLLWGLGQQWGERLMLTKVACQVVGVERLRRCSWEELMDLAGGESLGLRFISPTSFKQEGGIQPFPLPELVFGGLLRRWNHWSPLEWHLPPVVWGGRVAAYELKTVPLFLHGLTEIGAVGWVRYEFPAGEMGAIALRLARFGEFAGVGRKTGWGMGHVCVDVSGGKGGDRSRPKVLRLYG